MNQIELHEKACENRGKREKLKKRKGSEFGEMVITSAFQADFVGSSPIIRREKEKDKVFRGVIKHVREKWRLTLR